MYPLVYPQIKNYTHVISPLLCCFYNFANPLWTAYIPPGVRIPQVENRFIRQCGMARGAFVIQKPVEHLPRLYLWAGRKTIDFYHLSNRPWTQSLIIDPDFKLDFEPYVHTCWAPAKVVPMSRQEDDRLVHGDPNLTHRGWEGANEGVDAGNHGVCKANGMSNTYS
jgi:hypothetical protein